MEKLRRIGFANIQKAMKWHDSKIQEVVASGELDSDTVAAIAEVSSTPRWRPEDQASQQAGSARGPG